LSTDECSATSANSRETVDVEIDAISEEKEENYPVSGFESVQGRIFRTILIKYFI
jgi:hypothetical protein